MEILDKKLTDDAIAERMLAQLAGGYTAPELAMEFLEYIKLNQLEKKLEPEFPTHISSPNGGRYPACPNCQKSIERYEKPRFCYNCGQALKWITPSGGRFA